MEKKQFALGAKGLILIKTVEGCSLNAYRDVKGVPTIGYGHTFKVKMGDKITQQQADELLAQDLDHFENGVNDLLDELNVTVTQNQFDALVSFAFNVGLGALKRSTLCKKLYLMNQRDQASIYAVADQFLRWVYAGKKKIKGLQNRRNKERLLFLGVV
ncbi:lysozyme [Pasteurella skyensis]|uniref:Lysozyme n=1 Tax=Phocoenobacter skyensis TaxID=97481 RepID=A0AAJ6NBF4_9PAST|nr:lysozyme [Pasteurella skyensis]MDP8173680.1 lysozyme [Pasteurella skyensis]MDP8178048.1 lysozyme [Pasteurella skyensis]